MSDIPKTSRAACVAAYKEPLELRDIPIPDDIEPGAILVKTDLKICCPTATPSIKSTTRWNPCARFREVKAVLTMA